MGTSTAALFFTFLVAVGWAAMEVNAGDGMHTHGCDGCDGCDAPGCAPGARCLRCNCMLYTDTVRYFYNIYSREEFSRVSRNTQSHNFLVALHEVHEDEVLRDKALTALTALTEFEVRELTALALELVDDIWVPPYNSFEVLDFLDLTRLQSLQRLQRLKELAQLELGAQQGLRAHEEQMLHEQGAHERRAHERALQRARERIARSVSPPERVPPDTRDRFRDTFVYYTFESLVYCKPKEERKEELTRLGLVDIESFRGLIEPQESQESQESQSQSAVSRLRSAVSRLGSAVSGWFRWWRSRWFRSPPDPLHPFGPPGPPPPHHPFGRWRRRHPQDQDQAVHQDQDQDQDQDRMGEVQDPIRPLGPPWPSWLRPPLGPQVVARSLWPLWPLWPRPRDTLGALGDTLGALAPQPPTYSPLAAPPLDSPPPYSPPLDSPPPYSPLVAGEVVAGEVDRGKWIIPGLSSFVFCFLLMTLLILWNLKKRRMSNKKTHV